MSPIKVLIVDDSRVVRQVLRELLSQDPALHVVGEAEDPYEARELIKKLNPDVLTLDIEMPRMDGLTFLKNLMRLRPMPVVMLSTLTTKGADVTLDALEIGAVDFIAKPKMEFLLQSSSGFREQLIRKLKTAAASRPQATAKSQVSAQTITVNAATKTNSLIALGASTGGTEALRDVLKSFPANAPAVVLTQHIPAAFSKRFAERLDQHCQMAVHEATHGQRILPGNVYVAPGDRHLRIQRRDGLLYCQLDDSAPVSRHRPSVDVLFESVSKLPGMDIKAALLTGMGEDGAAGMLALKEKGALTIAQDEASSLIWGMPGSAVAKNAHCRQAPLSQIAKQLLD